MKVNDIVRYTGHGLHVQDQDRVKVLRVRDGGVSAYPLKWDVEGVPPLFQCREDPGTGLPYIVLFKATLKPHTSRKDCMFEEVVNNGV